MSPYGLYGIPSLFVQSLSSNCPKICIFDKNCMIGYMASSYGLYTIFSHTNIDWYSVLIRIIANHLRAAIVQWMLHKNVSLIKHAIMDTQTCHAVFVKCNCINMIIFMKTYICKKIPKLFGHSFSSNLIKLYFFLQKCMYGCPIY